MDRDGLAPLSRHGSLSPGHGLRRTQANALLECFRCSAFFALHLLRKGTGQLKKRAERRRRMGSHVHGWIDDGRQHGPVVRIACHDLIRATHIPHQRKQHDQTLGHSLVCMQQYRRCRWHGGVKA